MDTVCFIVCTGVSTCFSTESMNWFSLFYATRSRNILHGYLINKGLYIDHITDCNGRLRNYNQSLF